MEKSVAPKALRIRARTVMSLARIPSGSGLNNSTSLPDLLGLMLATAKAIGSAVLAPRIAPAAKAVWPSAAGRARTMNPARSEAVLRGEFIYRAPLL
jgi:hypothetical protein